MSHIHLPDGVLPLWIWLAGYLLTGLIVGVLWGRKRTAVDARKFALLGVFAALMFLVMSIEIPFLPYHANLSVVVGIVLGPSLAILAGFIVNLMLAFVGHGGITVVGVNTLVIAVEILAGYGAFRLFMRMRLPVSIAGFLAVVLGLGLGTLASYSVIAVSAPEINRTFLSQQHDAETTEDHTSEIAGEETHDHDILAQAATGGRLNLTRLAVLMFGLGALGWVLEGILSAAILGALNNVYPSLISKRE